MEEDDTSLNWKQLGQDIYGESVGDLAGCSVSLSSDGKTVAVGSDWNDDNGVKSGHVRVFNIGPIEIHTATVPDVSVEVISDVSTTTVSNDCFPIFVCVVHLLLVPNSNVILFSQSQHQHLRFGSNRVSQLLEIRLVIGRDILYLFLQMERL